MKNEIINILKEKYNITDDVMNRVDQLLECMQDDNVFYNLDEIYTNFLCGIPTNFFVRNTLS